MLTRKKRVGVDVSWLGGHVGSIKGGSGCLTKSVVAVVVFF